MCKECKKCLHWRCITIKFFKLYIITLSNFPFSLVSLRQTLCNFHLCYIDVILLFFFLYIWKRYIVILLVVLFWFLLFNLNKFKTKGRTCYERKEEKRETNRWHAVSPLKICTSSHMHDLVFCVKRVNVKREINQKRRCKYTEIIY